MPTPPSTRNRYLVPDQGSGVFDVGQRMIRRGERGDVADIMKIFPITRADLPECAALFVKVFNGEPWNESWSIEPVLARFNECFSSPGFLGLIGRNSAVICFALGYVETWDSSKHFFLKEMCVTPDRQRSGIGSELIAELEKGLIGRGIQKIYLLTARDGSAESFYRRNGFYVSPKMIMMGKYLTPEGNGGTRRRWQ